MSQQPIPGTRPALAGPERAAPGFPIWPCTRWGFPCRVACASRGALLPHLFTLTTLKSQISDLKFQRAVCFLWHCPSGPDTHASGRRPRVSQPYEPELRGIAPFGVRTFLPALSGTAEPRPGSMSGNARTPPVSLQFQKGLGDSPPFQNHYHHNRGEQISQGTIPDPPGWSPPSPRVRIDICRFEGISFPCVPLAVLG